MAKLPDLRVFKRGMKKLAKACGKEATLQEAEAVAQMLLSASVAAPAPWDDGMLAMSGTTDIDWGRGVVIFGFNKEYAHFQDSPDKSPGDTIEIKPKKKKALYIPLSMRGKKDHSAGNNPTEEGLEWGVDYVLARVARIQVKPYGSDMGPNAFFSGTLTRRKEWTIAELGRRLRARIGRELGGSK